MIRIPTGPVSKNTARNLSLGFGILAGLVSLFAPQYSDLLQKLGLAAGGLGVTLGKAGAP